MKRCPLTSVSGYESTRRPDCMGEQCALWDEAVEGCLIRTYLISQIEKSNIIVKPVSPPPVAELTPLEQRVEKLEKDVKYVGLGFPIDTFFGGGTK